jgi:phosphatidylglycerophosphate synthase
VKPAPTAAEVRAVGQPPGLLDRNSGEHWAGRLYIRRLSPHVTRQFARTSITPNGVTWLMIACGVLAGAALTVDEGVIGPLLAVLAIQLQILFDCSDGELARWQKRYSAAGIYLDRIGHVITAIALPVGLGIRAGEPLLGLVVAVLCVFVWASSAFVAVARLEAGLGAVQDRADVAAPRAGGLRKLRRALSFAPFFRAFVAMEFTLLCLAAGIFDQIDGSTEGSRALIIAMVPLAALTAVGRLAAILTSDRLR